MSKGAPGIRYAEVERETANTRVEVVLDLDGGTSRSIRTGIGIFDHMLDLMALHGKFDLGLKVDGDLNVDDHHSVEDAGIVLGLAISQAMAEVEGYPRFADSSTPVDDALVLTALDLDGRGYLGWDVEFRRESLGELATESVQEFFLSLAINARATLHCRKVAGHNDHHLCEALFIGVGRCIHSAAEVTDGRALGVAKKKK